MLQLLAFEYRSLIQDVLAFSVCLAALIWGAGPERAIAATWLIVFEFLSALYLKVFGISYQFASIDAYLALTDIAAGALWLTIALNANRNYPVWIAAFQLVAMGAHAVRGLVDAVSPFAYLVLATGPSYCQLALIFAGFVRHVRRERRVGPYRDWRFMRGRPALFAS